MLDTPLKILCLHGYRQSGEAFRAKTGSLRKVLKKHAELFYCTAPHIVPPLLDNVGKEDVGYGWWFSREDDFFNAKHQSDYVKGFEESLKLIEDYVKNNGPFDGVLGFSQGGCLAAILCHLKESNRLSFSFDFAIIISGFISQASPHQALVASPIRRTPSLHVYGLTDQVIGKQMSVDLLNHFHKPVVQEHQGGHFVPTSKEQKLAYIKFLEDVAETKKQAEQGSTL